MSEISLTATVCVLKQKSISTKVSNAFKYRTESRIECLLEKLSFH